MAKQKAYNDSRITTWRDFAFWRNNAIYFCVFSVVGHWMEIPYCLFNSQFGIVDPDSLVWDDPMYPFMVYGIAVVVCALFVVPFKDLLLRAFPTKLTAGVAFFIDTTFLCMLMELGMGLLLNEPSPDGIYPLWDNSELPGNILNQAWIVNDLLLGAVMLIYVWWVYPLMERAMAKLPYRVANVLAVCVVVGFVALCIAKF